MKKYFIFFIYIFLLSNSVLAQLKEPLFKPIDYQQVLHLFQSTYAGLINKGLLFDEQKINLIRVGLQRNDSFYVRGFSQMKQEAEKICNQPLLQYGLDDAKLRIPSIHQFAVQIPILALVYRVTGDEKFAQRAWKQMQILLDYPDWGAQRHFLDTGIGSFVIVFMLDGFSDFLTADQKRIIYTVAKEQLLTPGFNQINKNIWWSTSKHNWNGICHGGLITASLLLMPFDSVFCAKLIAAAVNRLPLYLRSFEPDGQSEEGLMYWGYGLMYTTLALQALHTAFQTSWNLDQFPGLLKTPYFPLLMSGPVAAFNVGDDPIRTQRSQGLAWFAHHYNIPSLMQYQYKTCFQLNQFHFTDLLYINPALITKGTESKHLPLAYQMKGIEMAAIRSSWADTALMIAIHGGSNNASHGHLDAGSFYLQAKGKLWAVGNLGRDDYTYPGYFSKITQPSYFNNADTPPDTTGRWHFYRLRTEGKNALVFNPGYRPEQDENGIATLLPKKDNWGDTIGFHCDLQNCYSRDVSFYTRTIQLNKTIPSVEVIDTFQLNQEVPVWWSMHTAANIKLSSNGREAVLQLQEKTLHLSIRVPLDAVFQVLPATYLPGRSFPLTKNTNNDSFRKLCINLKNTNANKISVVFY
jgi:hypothetical protein